MSVLHWFKNSKITLLLTIALIYTFFTSQGIVFESIFQDKKFTFGTFVSLVELLIYTTFAGVPKLSSSSGHRLSSPLWSYGIIAISLASARGLTLASLQTITYPTVMLIKSCKLIIVMVCGICWFGKKYSLTNYISALVLVGGSVLFSIADSNVLPQFHPIGVFYCTLSLVADSVTLNLQERILKRNASSESEMVFWSNLFGFVLTMLWVTITGELSAALTYCSDHPKTIGFIVLSSFLGYCGSKAWLKIIHNFGPVTATIVGNSRKVLAILMSFIIFPKPLVSEYILGTACFALGVFLNTYADNPERQRVTAHVSKPKKSVR